MIWAYLIVDLSIIVFFILSRSYITKNILQISQSFISNIKKEHDDLNDELTMMTDKMKSVREKFLSEQNTFLVSQKDFDHEFSHLAQRKKDQLSLEMRNKALALDSYLQRYYELSNGRLKQELKYYIIRYFNELKIDVQETNKALIHNILT